MGSFSAEVAAHAARLSDYFDAFNTGIEAKWEEAFRGTWHPDADIHGKSVAELREGHRGLLGKMKVEGIRVLEEIDASSFTYQATVNGKPSDVYTAVCKDGLFLRVIARH
jgi:hypothetical protein